MTFPNPKLSSVLLMLEMCRRGIEGDAVQKAKPCSTLFRLIHPRIEAIPLIRTLWLVLRVARLEGVQCNMLSPDSPTYRPLTSLKSLNDQLKFSQIYLGKYYQGALCLPLHDWIRQVHSINLSCHLKNTRNFLTCMAWLEGKGVGQVQCIGSLEYKRLGFWQPVSAVVRVTDGPQHHIVTWDLVAIIKQYKIKTHKVC